jgi:NAD(P)-dependent dehydrogenase (short-subunit alcohol dehydrogenase family)
LIEIKNSSGDEWVVTIKASVTTHHRVRVTKQNLEKYAAGRTAEELVQEDDFAFSLANKLMGQVNIVRYGMDRINDRGSFTLTSGVLAGEPMPGSATISLVNAGLEGFVRAAALELPRGIRVNVVSPPWVSETLKSMGKDPAAGMPAEQVAAAYVAAVEGQQTGQVLNARDFKPK